MYAVAAPCVEWMRVSQRRVPNLVIIIITIIIM